MKPYTPPEPIEEVLVITSPTSHSFMKAGQYYYTTDQLRAEVERVRRETVEECAKHLEADRNNDSDSLRSLK